MDGQIIRTSSEVFGIEPDEEEKKKKQQKSAIRKSSDVFGKPQVTQPPPRKPFQPTAGMPATTRQTGISVAPPGTFPDRPLSAEEKFDYPSREGFVRERGKWRKSKPDEVIRQSIVSGLRGVAQGMTGGAAHVPATEKLHWTQDITDVIGHIAGMATGAPGKLGHFGTTLFLKGLKNPKVARVIAKVLGKGRPAVGRIAEKILGESLSMGTMGALSEVEDIKGMPKRLKDFAIFGGIFGTARMGTMGIKSPLLSQITRQVGTRAMGRMTNLYSTNFWESVKDQALYTASDGKLGSLMSAQDRQTFFDEVLYSWFSFKRAKPGEIFADLQKINAELNTQRQGKEYKDKLRKMARTSGRKPEEIETWVEAEWQKIEPTLPKVWQELQKPGEVVETIGGRFIITGSGEVIPMDLFSGKIDFTALERGVSLEKPKVEPPKEVITKKKVEKPKVIEEKGELPPSFKDVKDLTPIELTAERKRLTQFKEQYEESLKEIEKDKTAERLIRRQPLLDRLVATEEKLAAVEKRIIKPKISTEAEKRRKMMEQRGLVFPERPKITPRVKEKKAKIEIEKPPPTGEQLASEIEKFAKAGKIEKLPSSEEIGKKKGFEKREERVFMEPELKEFHAGFNFFKALTDLDTHLQKKFIKEPAREQLFREQSKEIQTSAKEFIEKEQREKMPIWGIRVRTQMRRFGKTGNKIADMSDNFVKNTSQGIQSDIFKFKGGLDLIGSDVSRIKKALRPRKTSKEIIERVYDLLEGKRKPVNDMERAGFELIKEVIQTDKAQKARDLDIKISTPFGEKDWVPRKNYAPVEYDIKGLKLFLESKQFSHLRDMYIKNIAENAEPFKDLYKTDKTKALIEAEKYFEEFRNDLRTRPFGHLEQQRLLDEKALLELEAQWKKEYPGKSFPLKRNKNLDVLNKYIVGTNQRLEWIREFGKDMNWGKGWYIPEKLAEVVRGFEKARSREWTVGFFKQYLRQTSALDTRITSLIRGVRTFQLSKLAFAFIPNSLQWHTNTLPQIPVKAIPQTLWQAAKFYGIAGKKAKAIARKEFSETGASTLKQAVQLAMMENPSKVNAVADIMLKVHLFSGTEFNNALLSSISGAKKAIILSERLHKKGAASWRAPFYRAELKKLGLNEAKIERIIKDGPLTERNIKELADAGFYTRRATQFLADAFDLPKTWSTPFGRLLTQFKNFAYNQSVMLWEEGVKEAYSFVKSKGRKGDITKIMKYAIVLPAAGAAVTHFKKELYPKIGIHFYEELMAGKSWPFKLMVYVLNTGNLGLAMDALMSFRYGKAGLSSLVLGPALSDVGQFFEAVGNSVKELEVAFNAKNPKWLKHRAKTIRDYWLRFGERISPDIKVAVHNLFKDYRKLKSMSNWTQMVVKAMQKYKHLYKLSSPSAAEEYWNAFMQTQGKEYRELFGKTPNKPTRKEIERWWKEQGLSKAERFKLPGKGKETNYTFWY